MEDKIRILIADNHLLIREGVRKLIGEFPEFEVVADASESEELHRKIRMHKPDVVILDCFMPGFFKPEDIYLIYKAEPKTKVLIVTGNQPKAEILKVLEFGVCNYILKQCEKDEFINAVYSTAKREKFFCGKVVDAILEKHFPQKEHCEPTILSPREIEIIHFIAEGLTNSGIAKKLHLSVHTVSTHRRNILKKLQIKNSSELVMYAIKTGIITPALAD